MWSVRINACRFFVSLIFIDNIVWCVYNLQHVSFLLRWVNQLSAFAFTNADGTEKTPLSKNSWLNYFTQIFSTKSLWRVQIRGRKSSAVACHCDRQSGDLPSAVFHWNYLLHSDFLIGAVHRTVPIIIVIVSCREGHAPFPDWIPINCLQQFN